MTLQYARIVLTRTAFSKTTESWMDTNNTQNCVPKLILMAVSNVGIVKLHTFILNFSTAGVRMQIMGYYFYTPFQMFGSHFMIWSLPKRE